MAGRIANENVLFERVSKMIPKNLIKKGYDANDIIESVECDEIDGGESGYEPSYWVYLNDGFITENGCGCHTLHEDTLRELKVMMSTIVEE